MSQEKPLDSKVRVKQMVSKFFTRFLVTLLALQGAVAAQLLTLKAAHAAGTPEVVINEIMWMGSTASSSDEWIELRNTTNQDIDLSGWILTNSASSSGDLTISSGSVAANGYFLISNFGKGSASSVLNVDPDVVTTSISLSNTCQAINLEQSDTTIVDSIGCDGNQYFAGENVSVKKSMERNIEIADGTQASSWHSSVGFANLDSSASPNNFATPAVTNDVTSANGGLVSDSLAADISFTADGTSLSANWSGFTDPESGVSSYLVAAGKTPGGNDVATYAAETLTNHTFSGLSLVENTTYYVSVEAVNGAGINGDPVSSNGVTFNSLAPDAPTNLQVADTPNDNGGSLTASWTASDPTTSPDVTNYQLNYRRIGDVIWNHLDTGLNTTQAVTGLKNKPTSYEFTVEAIDFAGNQSMETDPPVVTQALDNQAPTLDLAKTIVSQNKPGNQDAISGQAGAVSQPDVTLKVFGSDLTTPINSVVSNEDGSFPLMYIGDNQFDHVTVELVNSSDVHSVTTYSLANDVVGPKAPTLTKLVANCVSDPCRVTTQWISNDPDSQTFQVSYVNNGAEHKTLEQTGITIAQDIATGKSYDFSVSAFDLAGNPSIKSNVFNVALTRGVKTTVTLIDGQPVITTEAISGSLQVVQATPPAAEALLVPPAKAAEPTPVPTTPNDQNGNQPLTDGTAKSQDWVRIFIVVVILLVIAGSFYALSRSINDQSDDRIIKPSDEDKIEKDSDQSSTASKRKSSGHNRNRRRR